MSRCPDEIAVGPYRVRVVEDQAAIDRRSVEEHGRLLGHYDETTTTITLTPDLGEHIRVETLLHELLHALTAMTGLADELGDDDEKIVRRLSPALLDTLRRNPHLVSYLTTQEADTMAHVICTKSIRSLDLMANTTQEVRFSREPDDHTDQPASLLISQRDWEEFGRPTKITVTIEPGHITDRSSDI